MSQAVDQVTSTEGVHTTDRVQSAKKIIFTACHSGKLKLAFTSPDVISTGPKNFCSSVIQIPHKTSLARRTSHLKTEFTSPIAKSTSPGLSDSTFFARWSSNRVHVSYSTGLEQSIDGSPLAPLRFNDECVELFFSGLPAFLRTTGPESKFI